MENSFWDRNFLNSYISHSLKNKIEKILEKKEEIKTKYPKVFETDQHDTYIQLNFNTPSYDEERDRDQIPFDFKIDRQKVPKVIQEEFESFVKQIIEEQ
ncbi:MAG: hypothetical protein MUF62_06795 [Chitinophagaceae bacterium]|jgi:hypothetical protein|nr:hypothetical protein [Chitinophagaceae bacterium]